MSPETPQPPWDMSRIPSDLRPQLESKEGNYLTAVQIFQNALRQYWILAGAAVGPEANAAVSEARNQLAMARQQAVDDGVNVELVESEFEKQLGVRPDEEFDLDEGM